MSRRLMLKNASGGGGGGLPSEYQQVEWISTLCNLTMTKDNLKYFDTLIPSQSGIGYAIKYARYSVQAQTYVRNVIRVSGYNTLCDANTSDAQAKIVSSNVGTVQYLDSPQKNNGEVFNVECNIDGSNSVFFDGVYAGQLLGQYTGETNNETICFMSRGNNASYPLPASIYFYYAELYKDGQKIGEYVPVYRKSDVAIGLFELLNQTFLLPSGNYGSFSKGADVN